MTMGMVIDYIDSYCDMKNPKNNNESNVRKANQDDFDKF